MSVSSRLATFAAALLLVGCAADHRAPEENGDGDSRSPTVENADQGGEPRNGGAERGELRPIVLVSDELDGPGEVAVRNGVAYIASSVGLVRVMDGSLERVFPKDDLRAYDIAIDGDWLLATTNRGLIRSSLDGPSQVIHESVGWAVRIKDGQAFFTSEDADSRPTLLRTTVSAPVHVDVVTSNVSPLTFATDGTDVYYFEYAAGTSTSLLRRVPVAGGEGTQVARVEGAGNVAIGLTPEFVFFATDKALYATRKNGAAAARTVFDRDRVSAMAADAEGVYFTTFEGELLRVYRASPDGKSVRLLGQWYGKNSSTYIAVEGSTLYVTAVSAGVLLKLPKQ